MQIVWRALLLVALFSPILPLNALGGQLVGSPKISTASLHSLRVWSIGQPYMGMRTSPRDPIACGSHSEWKNIIWLSRPGRSNCVAVLADEQLNPSGEFDYGPIPELPDITKEQAQALWGRTVKGPKAKSNERTYELIDRDKRIFFLDVAFQNDRLVKYRVRNSESHSPPWTSTMIPKPTLPAFANEGAEKQELPKVQNEQPNENIKRLILSDNSSDSRKKLAYLAVDAQGIPSIYPSPIEDATTGKPNGLNSLSREALLALWKDAPNSARSGVYSFDFQGYPGHWATFKVDLKFDGDRCQKYRVRGPGIPHKNWISTAILKFEPNGVALPPWIGCADGPFDRNRCGVDLP